ncbi:hypothetical protein CHH78_07170 [Shouchella clausii]|uniref:NodB homology domain-containing protein n=1 Tax=Shouchella clausii TaxID=79880 RepID=A0A268RV77_SHOCL|nr:polysaccharide deacetylase family protein [Shouchella clausii]PAD41340.1 hypothetical protein CHH54_17725 [Bacillus sp. 7520-S]MBU8597226.1 polysaccharide deacetylase family protein [Shouchella clausii]MCM3550579.1 polysaccharide deacetylase family protein [Shouchella clausii]MCY1106395.1 polysaccharide deacetylase family protein [Shouchella clausii]MED4160410.1 polysaccharide deacetylase family protein [Shouchella clausii]
MRKKGILAIFVFIICISAGLRCVQAIDSGNEETSVRQAVPLPVLQTQFPGVVFVKGDPASNQVALTFDDGPDPRFTEQVLTKLDQHHVPATFFVLGKRVEANPELLVRLNQAGHEVGNHTFSHPNLSEGSLEQLEAEVTKTEEIIEATIGYRPRLFRPPYGFLTAEQVGRLQALNHIVVGWDVDTLDWQGIPAQEVTETVLQGVESGSIILMHDGGDVDTPNPEIYSADALDEIIPELQSQGYTFVTVSELLGVSREK